MHLGASGGRLEPSWCHLGRSWARLGPSWSRLGPSWSPGVPQATIQEGVGEAMEGGRGEVNPPNSDKEDSKEFEG